MHLAIDLHLDKKKSLADKSGPSAAKKALPAAVRRIYDHLFAGI